MGLGETNCHVEDTQYVPKHEYVRRHMKILTYTVKTLV
jgi:hypothetical protein